MELREKELNLIVVQSMLQMDNVRVVPILNSGFMIARIKFAIEDSQMTH